MMPITIFLTRGKYMQLKCKICNKELKSLTGLASHMN